MLHEITPSSPVAPPMPMLSELVMGARHSLDVDPHLARSYLDRIAALLEGAADQAPAILPDAPADAGKAAVKGGLTPWQFARVRRFIDDNIEGSISCDALAGIARLSASHFCRAFKTSVGETPHSFVIRQRIRQAQKMMLGTSDTLGQIACACGMTDQAHLTRLFRRTVGDTPLAWRRTWRKMA
ncbi:AraC family transcriptional regulator [Lichenihabitans sp. Uapishka_5]|uniref:AraC family transcriptional regulator n=1 Tax=Lichenihabitans sp. Uapishka_5 TaxID=3037302 RepID=UPI0029E7FF50|nr:AraC family transcriptional regulator [Lichenihabitans sp. Uapishka_5]MDX7951844.1 AraC family transcriptional regulator [Lichenihabitans sp. Uapishka_5]